MKANIFTRCDVCGKYKPEQVEVKEGDKVTWSHSRHVGNSINISSRTGKVFSVNDDSVTAIYRNHPYRLRSEEFTLQAGVNQLTVMMHGECECKEVSFDE